MQILNCAFCRMIIMKKYDTETAGIRYENTVPAVFERRLNRFVAEVRIEGKTERVHVKNTGRLRELLVPGAEVTLQKAQVPGRKTAYDLISVYRKGLEWVNIDSLVPNALMKQYLFSRDYDLVRPEYTYGDSRFDFYMERQGQKYLLEVKGCTLERDGIGFFPDAPTERGVKHIHELIKAKKEGYWAGIAFVVLMPKVSEVRPNIETHPAFGEAMEQARAAGVQILTLGCTIKPDSLTVDKKRISGSF